MVIMNPRSEPKLYIWFRESATKDYFDPERGYADKVISLKCLAT